MHYHLFLLLAVLVVIDNKIELKQDLARTNKYKDLGFLSINLKTSAIIFIAARTRSYKHNSSIQFDFMFEMTNQISHSPTLAYLFGQYS